MLQYYKENIQLYILFLVSIVVGIVGGNVVFSIFLTLTIILMKSKRLYEELFYGFFFVLLISDSLEESLVFAKNGKNIYILLLSLFILADRKVLPTLNTLYQIFIPFFIFSFFTALLSLNEPFFITSIQKTVSYFLVFFVVPNLINKLYLEKGAAFFRDFIFFAFTILIIGFILKYVSYDLSHIKGGRYRGVFGNPNGLGVYCVLMFIIFYVLNDFFPTLFSRLERILIYGAIMYSMFLCGSRNGFVALFLFLLFQKFFNLSPFLGFIIFIITIFIVELISNNLEAVIMAVGLDDFFRLRTLNDGSGRYIAWSFAWKQIQHNFFIGKGFGYNEYYMRKYYKLLGRLGHQGGIHNSFLTFWMDQGLVGLLIYLRSYILTFIKASKNTKYGFPIMFAITFTALFESWLVGSLSVFAFLGLMIYTILTTDEIANGGKAG